MDTLGQSLNQGITQAITSAVTVVGVLVMHALHQLDHDARGPGHGAGLHGARGGGGEALPEALRGPAAPARRA